MQDEGPQFSLDTSKRGTRKTKFVNQADQINDMNKQMEANAMNNAVNSEVEEKKVAQHHADGSHAYGHATEMRAIGADDTDDAMGANTSKNKESEVSFNIVDTIEPTQTIGAASSANDEGVDLNNVDLNLTESVDDSKPVNPSTTITHEIYGTESFQMPLEKVHTVG